MGTFGLAWRYIWFHKTKSLIMIACIFLTAFLPIAIKILLTQFDQKIMMRAERTPAVLGAKGSQLDLTLNALYFKRSDDSTIPYSHVESVRESNLATPVPIHAQYTAQGHPVVGTSLDYFVFRGVDLAEGDLFTILGDCVVGSQVAVQEQLSVGDQILSDRENVLSIAGQSPLKLNVTGILNKSNTPDDWGIFVDLKTAWVIEGLGHGHQDLNQENEDSEALLSKDDNRIVASAGVASYIEITPDNLGSFHFHGETGTSLFHPLLCYPRTSSRRRSCKDDTPRQIQRCNS